ncbi:hypothetical protein SERLA73DRAFT_141678, partial [Serpula lacrymans var. lacrymans S7.3]
MCTNYRPYKRNVYSLNFVRSCVPARDAYHRVLFGPPSSNKSCTYAAIRSIQVPHLPHHAGKYLLCPFDRAMQRGVRDVMPA